MLSVVTIITNAGLGQGAGAMQWPAQNLVIIPMTVATVIAAIFIGKPWVQAVPSSHVWTAPFPVGLEPGPGQCIRYAALAR